MRISAGQLKGRKVAFPGVFSKKAGAGELRPTSSKVREALFDIIRTDVPDACFLDLYAGTGAVGFEALSRGADRVVLVEMDRRQHQSITRCIERLGLSEKVTALKEQVLHFLRRAALAGDSYDIIFADPPYASQETPELIRLLDSVPLLRDGGCLVVELPSRQGLPLPEVLHSLRHVRDYRYGDTMLALFRKGDPA